MNMDIEKSEIVMKAMETVSVLGNVVKSYIETSKYHDDTLNQMNQRDNSCKTERLSMVIKFLTPVVASGAAALAAYATSKSIKENKEEEQQEEK